MASIKGPSVNHPVTFKDLGSALKNAAKGKKPSPYIKGKQSDEDSFRKYVVREGNKLDTVVRGDNGVTTYTLRNGKTVRSSDNELKALKNRSRLNALKKMSK